jgi:hypothetical protein
MNKQDLVRLSAKGAYVISYQYRGVWLSKVNKKSAGVSVFVITKVGTRTQIKFKTIKEATYYIDKCLDNGDSVVDARVCYSVGA